MSSPVQAWPSLDEPAGARVFVGLRWVMLVLEAGVAVVAATALHADPWGLAGVVGVGVVSHIVLTLAPTGSAMPHVAGATLVFDAMRLTALLALTGGASTPLSAAYLVHVVFAALLLSPAWTGAVVLTAVSGYALLFAAPPPRHAHHDMFAHVVGMWVTVALVAPLVAGVIGMLRHALSRTARAAQEADEARQRDARLSALGTLAAGAAHELATPLSTIAIAAGELGRQVHDKPECAADVALVQEQVARCRAILTQLAADVGAGMGELHSVQPIGDVLDDALAALDLTDRSAALERIDLLGDDGLLDQPIAVPRRLLAHALSGLVKNALQASERHQHVALEARTQDADLVLEVRDLGPGMPAAVLDRAVEPFFTTKPPGKGTGLGLFVAASLASQLGGRLSLRSETGSGTVAALHLPWTEISP